ncbi:Pr6Pr family membrane protein [Agrococcus beijingensis]|uniref:Pr6Pr family membrane protein n=1 Tax=Agrococcus beijingensis TaxID=3068634 RepID=UPI0027415DB5|nr:Pr6Pr family membrane protein [Agrococcus sp. REN33]
MSTSTTKASPIRRLLLVGRAVIAFAILAAIVGQLITSVTFWTARGDASIALDLANFFSFFTIESNVLAMVVLAVLVAAQLGRPRIGRRFDVLLLCAATYMVVTGIVYNTLLRGIELPQGATLGWSNEVLHLIAPLWMLIDWLLSSGKRDLRFGDIGIVAVFPVVWLAYTLLRGPFTLDQASGRDWWYPYPFLDPATHANGYAGVAMMGAIVAATVLLAASGMIAISRAQRRRATEAAPVGA